MRTHRGGTRVRIAAAFVVGTLIIGGAFLLKQTATDSEGVDVVAITQPQSTRTYISKGTDWTRELQAATLRAAKDAPEITIGEASASEAAGNTVTDTFARSFFESYFRGNLSGNIDETNSSFFVHDSVATLASAGQDPLLTANDVVIGAATDVSIRAYGNRLVEIMKHHLSNYTEDELALFAQALQANDTSKFDTLTNIADAYEHILADTLKVAAPPQLIEEHVALLNAYQALGNDIDAMAAGQTDPVYALVRVQRYESDAQALLDALSRIYTLMYRAGIRYTKDEPGALFQVGAQ